MGTVKASRTWGSDTMTLSRNNAQQPGVPIMAAAGGVTPNTAPLAPPPPVPNQASVAPPLALILDELIAVVDGVNGALVASIDGFAVARSTNMPSLPAHAAVLAAGMGLAHQLAVIGGGNELRQLVIDHDEGLLLLWPLGGQRVLAILTSRKIDQRSLRGFVQSKAHWLAGELA
ncbi:MAG: putative regulator of Ras-like GTPase activity (Roadblock/LC7/MglB family) [Ilumatobacter sp.]|jgi:predicted regulator of Ras-like GTPase activity (Roadblock/LC7/MglB family)